MPHSNQADRRALGALQILVLAVVALNVALVAIQTQVYYPLLTQMEST